MAHECPDCGSCCYCGGGIDDCLLNDEADIVQCSHCDCKICHKPRDMCDCEPEFVDPEDFD